MRVCEHEWRERDGRIGDVFEARIGRKKSGRGEYGSKVHVETIGRNSMYYPGTSYYCSTIHE